MGLSTCVDNITGVSDLMDGGRSDGVGIDRDVGGESGGGGGGGGDRDDALLVETTPIGIVDWIGSFTGVTAKLPDNLKEAKNSSQ